MVLQCIVFATATGVAAPAGGATLAIPALQAASGLAAGLVTIRCRPLGPAWAARVAGSAAGALLA